MIKVKILIVEDQFVEADFLRMMLDKAGYIVTGMARSVSQAKEMIKKNAPDFVLLDIFLKGLHTGIDLANELTAENIPFIYLSANSSENILNKAKATQPYGFLVKPFREKDLLITLEIARYRHEHSEGQKRKNQVELKTQLTNILVATDSWVGKLRNLAFLLQQAIPFDYLESVFGKTAAGSIQEFGTLRIGYDEYQLVGSNELATISKKSSSEISFLRSNDVKAGKAIFYNDSNFMDLTLSSPVDRILAETFGLRAQMTLPLITGDRQPLSLCFYSRRSDMYNFEHLSLQNIIQDAFSSVRQDNFEGHAEIFGNQFTRQPNKGKPAPAMPDVFYGIIGKSHLLLKVFDEISQVATSDTSILILGESGTGKERVADCIHQLSGRKSMPFIKVNCATLPASLIESELFGHEKGSFTGASEKRIGKFERAHKGTIFLDEIGEMSLELQVKLLRVLQEREIEPIGSNDPVKVDIRVIAATNRNLEKEVAEGRFRLDLYYRLNVFPIILPALKDRKEDIPLLTAHFINHFNQKSGKKITGTSEIVLKALMTYHWPGNVRELEHLIERSVLMARKTSIEEVSLPKFAPTFMPGHNPAPVKTIHDHERDYIITVLKQCNGKIWGKGAAAELLNIPPSTLKSRMKKLQITKEYVNS